MNADKTEFMYFKQGGAIYTLNNLEIRRPVHSPW